MFIIGTAGHIDHGKSSIVRRLTGTDPDRLPEEQKRGMTIDLGFAFTNTDSGEEIGFIDVPGHERFVRNMISGAAGIDAVMLVIAADDGWMPQSQEHFQIVRLLGVSAGIIVINKCDLAEAEWLDLLEIDIREKCRGTFLESTPIVRVSAEKGSGFDSLRDVIAALAAKSTAERDIGKARMYIDRSFHRPGMGGVVTGTMRGGSMAVGQTVSIWPGLQQAKIRAMQSRSANIEKSNPGQRTAMSFTGVDRADLIRGGVVSTTSNLAYFRDNSILALSLELLKEAPIDVNNRRTLLLIVGTSEVTGEIRVFGQGAINPGDSGIVFFIPDEPIFALTGDHYVVRLPTPMVTIGGGRVLDHLSRVPRRRDYGQYDYLNQRLSGTPDELVISELAKHGVIKREALLQTAAISETAIGQSLARVQKSGVAQETGEFICHVARLKIDADKLYKNFSRRLKEMSHISALSVEELHGLSSFPRWKTEVITRFLSDAGKIEVENDSVRLAGHRVSLSGEVKKAYQDTISLLKADPYAPPTLAILAGKGKGYRDAIGYIIKSGEGHKCGSDFVFLKNTWDEVTRFIGERLNTTGALAVGDLREKFGFSRKFAIPILEETDRIGLTRRDGDRRLKGDKFEE